jgi:hypothetical protein
MLSRRGASRALAADTSGKTNLVIAESRME